MKNSALFTSPNDSHGRKIIGLFVAALVLRLVLAFSLGPVMEPDSFSYDNLAKNMLNGRGYTDTRSFKILDASYVMPPVYPLFLWAIYSIFGPDHLAVILIQQLLGAVNVLLVYIIGSRIFDSRVGFWSGILTALHPWLCCFGNTLMSEPLFMFLLSLSVVFFINGLSRCSWEGFALSGLLLGLSILCWASFQGFPIVVPLLLFLILKKRNLVVRYSLCYLVPVMLVLSVWGLRNYLTKGFFGIAPLAGIILVGINPPPSAYNEADDFEKALKNASQKDAQKISTIIPLEEQSSMLAKSGTIPYTNIASKILLEEGHSFIEINQRYFKIALKYILEHPLRYGVTCIYHGIAFWSGYQIEWMGDSFDKKFSENLKERDYLALIAKIFIRCVLAMALLFFVASGIYFILKTHHKMGLIPASVVVYMMVVCALLNIGYTRYRMPLEPFVFMICLFGGQSLKNMLTNKSSRFLFAQERRGNSRDHAKLI
jgi:hypothetical protein